MNNERNAQSPSLYPAPPHTGPQTQFKAGIIPNIFSATAGAIGDFPFSAPPALRAGLWLALAFFAAFIVYPGGWLYPQDDATLYVIISKIISLGRPLLHKLSPTGESAMPLLGVASLMAGNATYPEVQALWTAISTVICVLGYSLGSILAGRLAGVAAAAALFAGQTYSTGFFDIEQRFYCLILMLVANTLAFSGFSPRVRRLTESCAIGISFLARSALCWFPAMLAALELAGAKRGGLKKRLASAALTLAVPFLFLLPWIIYNAPAGGRFAIFDGRGDWNVATGAMGIVSTFEGDYRKLAGIAPGENAALWAAKRIITHPAPYVSGVAKRIWFVFSMQPVILLCWLTSTALLWRRPAFRRVNLLGIYFITLHTAFSVEERYLLAILPLLAAIAAASVFASTAESPEARKEGLFFLAAGALLPAAVSLFCMFLLLRAPGTTAESDKLQATWRALNGYPDNAWLLREYGELQLQAGDYTGAYRNFGKAVILSPADANARIDLATAAFLKNRRHGRPSAGSDLVKKLFSSGKEWPSYHASRHILSALYELDTGQEQQAAQTIRLGRLLLRNEIGFRLKSDATQEERLRSSDSRLISRYLPALLKHFPAVLKEKLCGNFVFIYEEGKLPQQICTIWCGNMLRLEQGNWKEFTFEPRDLIPAPQKYPAGDPAASYAPDRNVLRDILHAMERARIGHKRILLEIGGDWCVWCGKMDRFYKVYPDIAALRDRNFITVKVYVNQSGPPPAAISIYPPFTSCPHLYILSADGAMLQSKDTKSLEAGEGYDRIKFLAFLQKWAPPHNSKSAIRRSANP
ncbi:MAG: hypothetical protein A2X34_07680 [Elusimicrobia bacterium GWC2_51_8]|nr:MAG: hypothetical protein A2X33_08170 [Elusimicrobia bacterium GWA2_51_34]OGR59541.1 MAG: hypothetical protein A2X34_07680 [Elusimicrobia bacterium GWC2_51_8]HCE98963.1 hypothetical protein [Elusimicrobiota bacterium]